MANKVLRMITMPTSLWALEMQVKDYLKEADGYLKCLEGEEKAELKADKSTEETRAARLNLYNETVDEMQQTGAELNAEVGKFKARTDT